MYEFETKGTCAAKIQFDIIDGKLHYVVFKGGCDGNAKAIAALAEGADAVIIANKLKGISCGSRGTSCADQFSKAIEKFL